MTGWLFSELIRLNWLAAPHYLSATFLLFSAMASIISDNVCCSFLCFWKWQLDVSVFFCIVSLSMYLATMALFSRPFAPGVYLLLSLTVMKPPFKEQGAGSEASQIRSVKQLAGWAWWMRLRMSFCRGCIVKSFHCHRRAYEGLMNEGASVRNTLPLLPLLYCFNISPSCSTACLPVLPFLTPHTAGQSSIWKSYC